jgi:hypothetical protein
VYGEVGSSSLSSKEDYTANKKAILAETSTFSLDPKGAKPQWHGEMYHSVTPIHAILQ